MSKAKKLQKYPISLKEHIKQVYYRIELIIEAPAFRKYMLKRFNDRKIVGVY